MLSDGTWVYIKRQVDEDDAAALEKKNLPGVLFEQAMKRVYPYGNLASQVLGIVNVDNAGLTGLERLSCARARKRWRLYRGRCL